MKIFRTIALAAVVSTATSASLSAQSVSDERSGIVRTNLVSANPIGLLFEWYNGEFEHAITSTVSLAVAGSRFDFWDNDTYTSVDGIFRYYPAARALRGFSVGASVGYAYEDRRNYVCYDFCTPADLAYSDGRSTATLGVRADYVWILGRDQRFAAAAGIGAKRFLSDGLGTEGLPIGRLSIGYAF